RIRDSSISRHHCLIRLMNEEATLTDLGSSNGTFLNGERVRSQANMHSGDELRLGSCQFRIEIGDREESGHDTAVGVDPFTRTVKLPPEGVNPKASVSPPAGSPPPSS